MPVITYEDAMKGAQPAAAPAAPSGPKIVSYEDATAPQNSGSTVGAYLSDVAKIPGNIVGTPRMLLHDLPNWIAGQDGTNPVGANDPLARAEDAILPSAKGFNDAIGLTPHLVDHTTLPGKLSGAFIEGGGARALLRNPREYLNMLRSAKDLGEVGKTGLAATAAQGAGELDPGNLGLQLGAAALTHAGVGGAARITRAGYNGLLDPFIRPGAAGEKLAGATTAQVDNSQPGLASPTAMDLVGQEGATRAATDAFGPGGHPPAVMGAFRDFLDQLKGHLESSREAGAAPFYNRFRAEPLMDPPEALSAAGRAARWPLGLPDVGSAMGRAGRNMVGDTGGARAANNPYGGPTAMKDWTDFNTAGDPIYKQSEVPTPDLLDRTKRQLNIKATQASAGLDSDTAASRMNQAHQVTGFIKGQYPDTYPQALDAYAKGSVPLTDFEHPDVARTLTKHEGTNGTDLGHTMGSAELLNHMGASASPGETVQSFINAVGDKKAAIGPLQDAIVGHLRETPGVIDPSTGEVNAKALDQATRKYMPTISMYFPELGRKFGTAKGAQETLDTMRSQDTLAKDVSNGGMRTSDGVVTPASFKSWIDKNEKTLSQTQSPGAMMRLRQIANALSEAPFSSAEGVAEAAPGALGVATGGGLEGGFTGMVLGKLFKGPFDARLGKAREAYSRNIEQAVTDPVYAAKLGRAISGRPSGTPSWKALMGAIQSEVGEAAKYAPIATTPSAKAQ